jgi:hypothetical protein
MIRRYERERERERERVDHLSILIKTSIMTLQVL